MKENESDKESRNERLDRQYYMAKWILFMALLALAVIWALIATVKLAEAADPDPSFAISEAHGFSCLIACGADPSAKDMLIMVRYDLTKSAWRNASYMEVITCFDSDENNPLDLCQTSLLSGVVSHTFYNGPQATGTLTKVRTPPRISHGVSALYVGQGHSLTFGDSTYETCFEPSASLFSPASPKCLTITWHTLSDQDGDSDIDIADARVINAAALQGIISNLQDVIPGRTGFMTINGLITDFGSLYAREAYVNWIRAAPDAFAVSGEIQRDVALNASETAAETAIAAESSGTTLFDSISDFRDNHMPGTNLFMFGGLIAAGSGVILVMSLFLGMRSAFIAVSVFALFLFGFGVLNNLIDWKLYATLSVLMFALVFAPWVKRRLDL